MVHSIIFFDLDGTLVDSQGQVPEAHRQAIQKLKAAGHLPVICTGRGRGELGSILTDTGIETAILLNGMEILQGHELIYQGKIALETVQALKDLARQQGHELGYYSGGSIKVETHTATLVRNFTYFHQALPSRGDKRASASNCQMLLLFSEEPERDQLYQGSLPELTFARNSPYSLDVTPTGTDKGAGIRHLLELLQLDGPSYAFGDGLNDLPMFAAVDTAIAMGHAKPEVQAAADRVILSQDQAGIPQTLRELGLID